LQKFKSRTLIQPLTALAANFCMISCRARFVKRFFHFLFSSRQADFKKTFGLFKGCSPRALR
ncbi:hypothetical protein BACCAP_00317, partial [Pseudoflavonifractor capillosus ATCC 29799]